MSWLRGINPPRADKNVGSAIVARTKAVHTPGEPVVSAQPATSMRKAAGADSVRRRLSSIFQRPINGMAACDLRGMIHGRSCQSPRSEEHTSELQSHHDLVCRLLLEKKKKQARTTDTTD